MIERPATAESFRIVSDIFSVQRFVADFVGYLNESDMFSFVICNI